MAVLLDLKLVRSNKEVRLYRWFSPSLTPCSATWCVIREPRSSCGPLIRCLKASTLPTKARSSKLLLSLMIKIYFIIIKVFLFKWYCVTLLFYNIYNTVVNGAFWLGRIQFLNLIECSLTADINGYAAGEFNIDIVLS